MKALSQMSPIERFHSKVVDPDLSVRSGVYSAVSPSLRAALSPRGEYEYAGLDELDSKTIEQLLKVSAFGEPEISEDQFAAEAFSCDGATSVHPIIGHYRGLFAGYASEQDFREIGSSGGLATWLLVELLRTGRIDGVIHIAPGAPGAPLFQYRVSRSEQEIRAGAKSRYYPGHLGDVLNEIRLMDGKFAVTAIPSFAYELRLLQRHVPEFADRIAYVIGLVCGHQKTANYALNLAWHAGIAPSELKYIDFRKKDDAKPANHYTTEFIGQQNGLEVRKVIGQENLFGNDWGLGMFKSNFSDFTEDIFNETADVVFGDAWLPQFTTDSRGTNIIITRHPELDGLLRQAAVEQRIHLEGLTEQAIMQSQASLVRQCFEELPARYAYLARQHKYVPKQRRSGQAPISFARRMVQVQRYQVSQATHDAWIKAIETDDLAGFDTSMADFIRKYSWAQRLANVKKLPSRFGRKLRRLMTSRR
jgi:coenzyme F420-reducing hydrogenase beta subunit